MRPRGSSASENPGMKMELGGGGERSFVCDRRTRSPGERGEMTQKESRGGVLNVKG